MNEITLNCAGLETKAQLHGALAEALSFPDWYGKNLDALYDCLTDLDEPVHLHLIGWEQLPAWKAAFEAVMSDAENDCIEFIVTFE